MKVVLIAESMMDYALEFAGAVALRCDVTLLAPERSLAPYRPQLSPSIDAPVLHWPRLRSLRNARFLAECLSLIRSKHPDIIHVISQTLTWPALILGLRGAVPLLETVHDVIPHPGDVETTRIPTSFSRLLRAQADALIVHGHSLADAAAKRYDMAQARIFVVPHIALHRYGAIPVAPKRDPEKFDVLFFGRVLRYKGLDVLISAAEEATKHIPGLRVTVAGTGPDLVRCLANVKSPPLFDIRDRFIGDEETAALFTRTDVVVLPYIEASQSGVAALAIAFAKPIIASDVGDLKENIRGVPPAGILVEPSQPQRLAEALVRLVNDRALLQTLSDGGRELAQGPMSATAVGAQMHAIYRAVIARSYESGRVA